MSHHFIEYHKTRPIMVNLPENQKIEVRLDTERCVIDEYSGEHYFNVNIIDREKFHKVTNKMIEHYVYEHFKFYLPLFTIDGDVYIRFKYL